MILNQRNVIYAGRKCKVMDADGNEVKWCIRANTKTGRVVCLLLVLADCKTRLLRVSRDVPAPLIIEWVNP